MKNFILCMIVGIGCVCAVDAHADSTIETPYGVESETNFADPDGYKRFELQLAGGEGVASGEAAADGAGASAGEGCSR